MRRFFVLVMLVTLVTLVTLLQAGCDTFAPAPPERCVGEPAGTPASSSPVWHRDVRPIVEGRCTRCHQQGGIGPFVLTSRDDVIAHLDEVRAAVVSRLMPPWLPAHCCRDYAKDFSLTPDQIATMTSWIDDGAPEGDPLDVGDALDVIGGLPRIDLELTMDEPYQPAPAEGEQDDFRCFVVDWPSDETQTQFVTGFDLLPGDRRQVHHAIVFIAAPDQVQTYRDLDKNEDGAGWSCPGGFLFGVDKYVGGWGPGRDGAVAPAGHGHEVAPGSALVLAMHYARHDGTAFTEDQTTIHLVTEDAVDAPLQSVWIYNAWWPLGTMGIPKGEADVRHSVSIDATDYYSAGKPITVFSAAFHMHEHGRKGFLGVRRADGSEECLMQIDAWDPSWQADHEFIEPIVLEHGDQIFIECRFDNETGDVDLNWAEDSEMCVAFLTAEG